MQFTFTTDNWLSSSTVCGIELECGCEYYGRSVDAAGGRGIVEKINSRW